MDSSVISKMDLFSELVACGQKLSYWELDAQMELIRTTCKNPQVYHSFLQMDESFSLLLQQKKIQQSRPVLYTSSIGLSWICVAELVEQVPCRIYVVGPAFLSDISYTALESSLSRKNYPKELIAGFVSHIQDLPTVSLDIWMRYALMLHYCVTEEKLDISDLQYEDMSTLKPTAAAEDNAPYPKDGTWYAEQMVLKTVEEGRLDYKKFFSELSSVGSAEVMATNPSLRKMKNYMISMNALVTRAAIRGGLDTVTTYHLGETYLDAIEAAPSIIALMHVCSTMYEDFIQRVHRVRSASGISPTIQSVCSYIDMHLGEKLSMQVLAAQVGYADYYLAQKFKKEMGMTVNQFIKQRRVEQAKLLLKGTNQSIAAIADTLGFCNSSHFSDAFRSITGMTPNEYREGNL